MGMGKGRGHFFLRLTAIGLIAGLTAGPAGAQVLRIKVSANSNYHPGFKTCYPQYTSPGPLAGVTFQFRAKGQNSVRGEVVTTGSYEDLYVDLPEPDDYAVRAFMRGHASYIAEFPYLEGLYIHTIYEGYQQNDFTASLTREGSAKAKNPQSPWDYWLALTLCPGGALAGSPPKITFFDAPREIVEGAQVSFKYGFFDAGGDVTSIHFEIFDDDSWRSGGQFDISAAALGKTSGTLERQLSCTTGRRKAAVLHCRAFLVDSAANQSEPWEYWVNCVKKASAKILGQAVAFDAQGDPVGEAQLASKLPKPSAKAGKGVRTACESEAPLQFCRTLPKKARLNKLFQVSAQASNIGAAVLSRLRIAETAGTEVLAGECQNVKPGAVCTMTYSGRLVKAQK